MWLSLATGDRQQAFHDAQRAGWCDDSERDADTGRDYKLFPRYMPLLGPMPTATLPTPGISHAQ